MDTKMLKYTTFFSGTFTLSEANRSYVQIPAEKVALWFITSGNICRRSMYCAPLSRDTSRALFWCDGTLCALIHKTRPIDSGSDKTPGARSTQCKAGGGGCWIYFTHESLVELCLIFWQYKSLPAFFLSFLQCRKTSTQFPGQPGQNLVAQGSINGFLFHWCIEHPLCYWWGDQD